MKFSELVGFICGVCLIWYLWLSVNIFSYRPETTIARMVDHTRNVYEFHIDDTLYRGSPMYTHRGEVRPRFKLKRFFFIPMELDYDQMMNGDKVVICYSPRDPLDFAVPSEDGLTCTPHIWAKMSVVFRWFLLPFILPILVPFAVIIELFSALFYSLDGQENLHLGFKLISTLLLAGTRLG